MPTIHVSLPATITTPQPPLDTACEAATVAEALRTVAAQAPRYAQRLFFRDRLLVCVLLNGRHLPPGEALATPLATGDRLEVMMPVAGG